ncbi:epimerase [Pseudoalteromonas sp. HM-SA03]|uniref:NAD-dependent epimerase/dehydratase family protein n=1 Tax=Pseudoalteromonas sp. HM-SA03 TaxID=2029678 RepID=UPI000BAE3B46|nr:NAD(P)-dependent oxidoreductase [Pseudoalteromonas sp. HM-SA03]PAY01030.1 epimerase [Pseudoalteromonas sp. HM-SA03]
MRILVTGSAGRIGRAIYIKLMKNHDVVGLDKAPCSTVDFIGDICDGELISTALEGVDAVVHTAALHAPHVGLLADEEFLAINVDATEQLALAGIKAGIQHFVFTSTTALYGYASSSEGATSWITEQVEPQPKSIYHKSKILAENKLNEISNLFDLPVTVLQISRCFPEPADLMAIYRLTRGIDVRDVANAHSCAIVKRLNGFNRFIISGSTPFSLNDCEHLYNNASAVLKEKCPEIATAFEQRGWSLPARLDRVYDSSVGQNELGWLPSHSFASVLDMLDNEIAEVLPVLKRS